MKMNQFKKELLVKEFPWLEGIDEDGESYSLLGTGSKYRPIVADEVTIKRVDEALLGTTPWEESYSWSCGGHEDFLSALAIVGGEAIYLASSSTWATGSGDRGNSEAPTIGEQLRVRGLSPDYIVLRHFEDTDDNGNGEESLSVTIYKNKGTAQTDYERSELKRAYKALMAEIESA